MSGNLLPYAASQWDKVEGCFNDRFCYISVTVLDIAYG